MTFSPAPLRDILVIDLETSGVEPEKHGIVQIGAVVLDQVEYLEHAHFSSYIRLPDDLEYDEEAGLVNQIPENVARSAFNPRINDVLDELEKFADPRSVTLAAWNGTFDFDFLRFTYRKLNRPWPYDYHFIELWTLAWFMLPEIASPSLAKVIAELDLDKLKAHDALEDVRMEASVLRELAKRIPKNKT